MNARVPRNSFAPADRLPLSGEGSSLPSAESQVTNAAMRADLRGEDGPSDDQLVGMIPLEEGEGGEEGEEQEEDEGGEEGEEGGEEGEEGASAPEEGDKLRVKVRNADGEQVETTLGDLRAAYRDRTKLSTKLQEADSAIDEISNQAVQHAQAQVQEYQQALLRFQNWIVQIAAPEFEGVDLRKLATENPAEHIRLTQRMNDIRGALQTLEQERVKHAESANAEGQQARAAAAKKSVAILRRDIKGWDSKVYNSVLAAASKNYGFSPEEVGAIIDPRVIKMAYDAQKYRENSKSTASLKKVIAKKPAIPVARPGKGNVRVTTSQREAAFGKFMKSRSDADAVAWLTSRGIK